VIALKTGATELPQNDTQRIWVT